MSFDSLWSSIAITGQGNKARDHHPSRSTNFSLLSVCLIAKSHQIPSLSYRPQEAVQSGMILSDGTQAST